MDLENPITRWKFKMLRRAVKTFHPYAPHLSMREIRMRVFTAAIGGNLEINVGLAGAAYLNQE